ncbi:MAG TPA: hypothetical protein VLX28_02160 [Thermoanaerobaculia bacterium]|nr:hypothetical protein [Thermoanaerobaculia bacterium]
MSTLSRRNRIFVACVLALVFLTGCIAGRLSADQPHMQAALEHLRMAKGELEKADEDKGGHRVKAIRLTNDAIGQVEKGIEFDRHH